MILFNLFFNCFSFKFSHSILATVILAVFTVQLAMCTSESCESCSSDGKPLCKKSLHSVGNIWEKCIQHAEFEEIKGDDLQICCTNLESSYKNCTQTKMEADQTFEKCITPIVSKAIELDDPDFLKQAIKELNLIDLLTCERFQVTRTSKCGCSTAAREAQIEQAVKEQDKKFEGIGCGLVSEITSIDHDPVCGKNEMNSGNSMLIAALSKAEYEKSKENEQKPKEQPKEEPPKEEPSKEEKPKEEKPKEEPSIEKKPKTPCNKCHHEQNKKDKSSEEDENNSSNSSSAEDEGKKKGGLFELIKKKLQEARNKIEKFTQKIHKKLHEK